MKQLLLAALIGLAASPAFAHAHLELAQPAAGATVPPPVTELTLKFTEDVSLAFTGLTLTGPAGAVSLGTARLDPADGALLIAPLAAPLPAGTYTVSWHALSTDGHKTNGSYSFTVQ